jgi:hypothetical protein
LPQANRIEVFRFAATMKTEIAITSLLAAVLLLLPTDSVVAQRSRPAAFTNPTEAGPDYLLQGEYAGWAYIPTRSAQWVGLQVVALGDGKFEAVEYLGGLPGNGWDRTHKKKLSGQIENGQLVLTGPDDRVFVGQGLAISVDNGGRELWRLVQMQRTSRTLGLMPPPGAVVLFNGSSTDQFQPGAKVTPDGLLLAGVMTKMPVGAFRMHLEFRTPFMPSATGQARANSGVYIQRRYEVQILDSFGLDGVFNECAALYRQTPPDINMAFPPLTWQTYDIWFTPPQFADDGHTKLANARITVLHNGVPVHWHRDITAKTGGGQQEASNPLPINLQDHGNPVAFRNIWLVPNWGDEYVGSAAASNYLQTGSQRTWFRWRQRGCR